LGENIFEALVLLKDWYNTENRLQDKSRMHSLDPEDTTVASSPNPGEWMPESEVNQNQCREEGDPFAIYSNPYMSLRHTVFKTRIITTRSDTVRFDTTQMSTTRLTRRALTVTCRLLSIFNTTRHNMKKIKNNNIVRHNTKLQRTLHDTVRHYTAQF
jgi:hypothetical protein